MRTDTGPGMLAREQMIHLPCSALLCSALLCFALLCFALRSTAGSQSAIPSLAPEHHSIHLAPPPLSPRGWRSHQPRLAAPTAFSLTWRERSIFGHWLPLFSQTNQEVALELAAFACCPWSNH